ncbi:hypothetical protein Anapl_12791, partial [Anas platyrhynchos]
LKDLGFPNCNVYFYKILSQEITVNSLVILFKCTRTNHIENTLTYSQYGNFTSSFKWKVTVLNEHPEKQA